MAYALLRVSTYRLAIDISPAICSIREQAVPPQQNDQQGWPDILYRRGLDPS
ncbi:MAG: hypothetical protein WBX14_04020 [Candidatus Udaeobacter sp.]